MTRTTAPKNRKRNQARARATTRPAFTPTPNDAAQTIESPAPSAAPAGRPSASSSARRQVTPYQNRFKLPSVANRAPASISSALSREQEYAFIRADLYRLLIIAGILTVVMILLLLVVD